MKHYIIKGILAIAAVVALATGCKGFLDEQDQSKFIANKAEHFSSVLLGEFNAMYDPFWLCPFMTDELMDGITVSQNTNGREQTRPAFCWQRDIEKNMTDFTQMSQSEFWAYCYKIIAICNNLFENIDECGEDEPGAKDYALAEGSFITALMYFNLVNLYAEPYRAATAATTMGVPIKEGTGIDDAYDRAMLNEVYDKIVNLLKDALQYLQSSGIDYKVFYKINEDAVRILLSRVYLFMGQWDDVISTLEPVMKRARLHQFPENDFPVGTSVSGWTAAVTWDTGGNSEVVYTYGRWTQSSIRSFCQSYYYNVSNELFNLYDETDKRLNLWFNHTYDKDKGVTIAIPYKGSSNYTRIGQIVMRYAEAYLNIAEAYARKNDTNAAKSQLEKFLASRHTTIDGITLPTTQKELVAFIMDERLREFCFEDHFRWFDLRRMEENERPELVHEFKVMQNAVLVRTETYHLLKNDPNYTLSLPYKEKDNNPMIMDYDRFDKVPY